MTDTTTTDASEQTVEIFWTDQPGINLRGRRSANEYEAHAADCQDAAAIRKSIKRLDPYYEQRDAAGSLSQVKAAFDDDLGEQGWNFADHVALMPCVRGN